MTGAAPAPDLLPPDLLPDGAGVLLLAVVGSTAYGLAGPHSDVDRLGVMQAPTATILGLNAAAVVDRSVTCVTPDVTVHELGKFARLCLQANPTTTELLWADAYDVTSEAGALLVSARNAFLSEPAVRAAYTGYAQAQADRVVRQVRREQADGVPAPARTRKHARHCARLLLQAEQLLGSATLTLDVSGHRDELFTVGDLAVDDPAAFSSWFQRRVSEVDAVRSVLPASADVDRVEQLVRRIRLDDLRS